jgi:hypothetical protein
MSSLTEKVKTEIPVLIAIVDDDQLSSEGSRRGFPGRPAGVSKISVMGGKEFDVMAIREHIISTPGRRRFIQGIAIISGALATLPAWAAGFVDLDLLAGGPKWRDLTTAFPQKGQMILQRTRPPLLETPFEVFDRGIFTPNNQFYVRWHWAVIPWNVDVATFRLAVRGHVNQVLSLSMADIIAMPRVELKPLTPAPRRRRQPSVTHLCALTRLGFLDFELCHRVAIPAPGCGLHGPARSRLGKPSARQ